MSDSEYRKMILARADCVQRRIEELEQHARDAMVEENDKAKAALLMAQAAGMRGALNVLLGR